VAAPPAISLPPSTPASDATPEKKSSTPEPTPVVCTPEKVVIEKAVSEKVVANALPGATPSETPAKTSSKGHGGFPKWSALDKPGDLYKKGKCDKEQVKEAATMTREEWNKHQKGMAAKWPPPPHMKGKTAKHQIQDETFAIVTCWTAETQIEYRAHAKAPGSKSHLRYEQYSKAKTVGEALGLSSYPADWCWDFEHGYLRVVGGHIRDEPADTSKMSPEEVTAVDKHIQSWYVRELARAIGCKVSWIQESAGWGESLTMRGLRLLAQREARERLEAADRENRAITEEEVYRTLKRWPFFKNPWRQNVTPEGQSWVLSENFGLLRDRQGDVHLTTPTRRYPQVAELFTRWLSDRLPEETRSFKCTSINVNCNYAARLHRDNGNFGPSFIAAFGEFTGGELNYWPEDAGGKLEAVPHEKRMTLGLKDGLALFNGNCAHSVEDFSGARYSLVFFTVGCHALIEDGDREKMAQLGFRYPSVDEDSHSMLRPPRGYTDVAQSTLKPSAAPATGKYDDLPPVRYWKRSDLKAEVRKDRPSANKRRLSPENKRTFYGTEERRAKIQKRMDGVAATDAAEDAAAGAAEDAPMEQ